MRLPLAASFTWYGAPTPRGVLHARHLALQRQARSLRRPLARLLRCLLLSLLHRSNNGSMFNPRRPLTKVHIYINVQTCANMFKKHSNFANVQNVKNFDFFFK